MLSPADTFRALSPERQAQELAGLKPEVRARLLRDWSFWARPDQLPPEGNWRTWLILAGRGWGKSRTGAEWVKMKAEASACRIALVGLTASDCRDVMVEGDSGILSLYAKDAAPLYEPSKRRITWANGSIATTYNASEPDQLRGPQHHYGWVDELAKFPHAQDLWDQLAFGMRLGDHPQLTVTTTPRPMPIIRKLMDDKSTVVTRGRTLDNRANLASSAVDALMERYQGTRLGRQELEGEIVDDVVGALWTRKMLDDTRAKADADGMPLDQAGKPIQMSRVVVAIDPSGADGEDDDGDEIGIVTVGRGVDGRGYVIADSTCRLSPEGWARVAATAYHRYGADRLVAERNFGGAMVAAVLRQADRSIPFKEVVASRGKAVRAEPVSALFEQGRVSIVGSLPELEDQMCLFTSAGYMGDGSPDRVDALVWALTEVMLGHQRPEPVVSIRAPSMVSAFARKR